MNTMSSSLKDIHAKNKSVKVYAICDSDRCLVKLLDFYFSKLPENPKAFYLRPLTKVPSELDRPWFSNVPIGINTIRTIMSKMSKKAGLSTTYTNHSLRATSASRLFAKNVPEKIIQEKKSGHRSLSGLRAYEHTTTDQTRAVTRVLQSCNSTFSEDNVSPPFPEKEEEKEPHITNKENVSQAPVFSGQLHTINEFCFG